MTKHKTRLFSGIQPSGKLNIGHYIGAIQHWVALQNQHHCFFCIVNLHTITVAQDPNILQEHCYDLAALYLACGIDPKQSTIFIQSHVAAHSQLAWILTCLTHMGELSRMTQFKDKSQQHSQHINAGLFCYPVLMAADILLYQTNLIPVGEDQQQHLELARQLANRFNQHYDKAFTVPKAYIAKYGNRIMRLQDPTKKMSKSDTNSRNTIELLDSPDIILKKIKRAVTDSGSEIRYMPDKPGISNLLTIFAQVTQQPIEQLEKQYRDQKYSIFKQDLADSIIERLVPIQEAFHLIRSDTQQLDTLLQRGASEAELIANQTLSRVQLALGLLTRHA